MDSLLAKIRTKPQNGDFEADEDIRPADVLQEMNAKYENPCKMQPPRPL
jgi:hypothetical protein